MPDTHNHRSLTWYARSRRRSRRRRLGSPARCRSGRCSSWSAAPSPSARPPRSRRACARTRGSPSCSTASRRSPARPRRSPTVARLDGRACSSRASAGTLGVAVALGLPHPVLAALVILPALDVAGAFPLTPGSIGIGSGAVAVVLASRGIGMTQALAVGLAIQARRDARQRHLRRAGVALPASAEPGRPPLDAARSRVALVGASTAAAAVARRDRLRTCSSDSRRNDGVSSTLAAAARRRGDERPAPARGRGRRSRSRRP